MLMKLAIEKIDSDADVSFFGVDLPLSNVVKRGQTLQRTKV